MIILVTGVSGVGKSTVGRALAAALGWRFADADDYHSPANIATMRAGGVLDEAARGPWLDALAGAVRGWLEAGEDVVLAVPALRRAHRARLVLDPARMRLVHLTGDPALIAERLGAREGHFAPPSMLPSQLAQLEPPVEALSVDVSAPPAELVARIRRAFGV